MYKAIVVLFGIFVYNQAFTIFSREKTDWEAFKTSYNKQYKDPNEESLRFAIFSENVRFIKKHNERYDRGEVTFHLAVNKFADLLNTEFRRMMNGFNRSSVKSIDSEELGNGISTIFIEPENIQIPDEMDWRKEGAVTPVKNQEQCGSCWAFSATGSLEGQHFRHNGTLISLSEQNLVDCSGRFGNDGCNGGLMNYAFTYVKVNKGIDTEKSYPYLGEDESCRFNRRTIGADDAGYVNIPAGSEQKLLAAVATVGPISVAIDASHSSFQFYSGGVYVEPNCSTMELDHGVLAIGYGTSKNSMDYWLVKNSWGTDWGQQGYILMARNRNNMCGIASSASYPLVK